METEIKLSPVSSQEASKVFADEALAPFLGSPERTDMESIYYKDKEGLLEKAGAAIRVRTENGTGVCCLKIRAGREGAAFVRQEYEVNAETVEAGAQKLLEEYPIPEDAACILKNCEFYPVCGTSFTRTECEYRSEELSFILSYDIGEYFKGDLRAPLGEIELELKEGSVDLLNQLCLGILERHGLSVCTVSKYARALSLEPPAEEKEEI